MDPIQLHPPHALLECGKAAPPSLARLSISIKSPLFKSCQCIFMESPRPPLTLVTILEH